MSRETITFEYEDENGNEIKHEFPAINAVCSRCEGYGHHTNPSIDGNGITESEMEELGEDFREGYFNGVYDITCERCKGEKVILVIDTDAVEHNAKHKEAYVAYLEDCEVKYHERLERDAEERFGC